MLQALQQALHNLRIGLVTNMSFADIDLDRWSVWNLCICDFIWCGASGEWKYDIQMLKCKRSNIVIQLFKYFESKQHWQWPVGTDPGIEKRSFIESAHLSIPIWRQCWTPTPRWAILWTIWNLPGHLSSDLDILVWTRNLAAWWQEVFDLLLPLWRCFKWYCVTKVWQSWLGQDFKL